MENRNTTFAETGHFAGKSRDGKDQLICMFKATYEVAEDGALTAAEEQPPLQLEDVYLGQPGESTLLEAGDLSLGRPRTEFGVIGSIYPEAGETNTGLFQLKVGPLERQIRAFGIRRWQQRMSLPKLTDAEPFDKVPLHFEYAFGGVDQRHEDPKKHGYESRNPIGQGFLLAHTKIDFNEISVPQLEDPQHLIKSPYDKPPPACSAFIPPHWEPRKSLAGTYDDAWDRERKPLLPNDFDPLFCHAVDERQIFPERARGDETVEIHGLQPATQQGGRLALTLPGLQPTCEIEFQHFQPEPVPLHLEKIVVNAETRRLVMLWCGYYDRFGDFMEMKGTAFHLDT